MQHGQSRQVRRSKRAGWVSVLCISGLLVWSELGYGGGPTFTQDVRVENTNPDVFLTNTQAGASSWRLQADEPVDNGFAISWLSFSGLQGANPFVIEHGSIENSLYIHEFGLIGIGTDNPLADLHVKSGSPKLMLEYSLGGPAIQRWSLKVDAAKGALSVVDDTNGFAVPFGIEEEAADGAVWVDRDGRVGFGTKSPNEAIDVVGDGATRFQLTSFADVASDAAQFIQRRARGTQDAPTAVQNGDNIGLFSFRGMRPNGNFSGSQATITAQATEDWTNSARGTRLMFGTTENGTSTVITALEITHDGRVLIDGTQLSVPDEVFADDYALMPLDELKAYLAEHRHLPEVASEAEVKQNGVDLGKTQMALLKKVEELTLYTITQQEQLAALAAQNTQLHQQLAEKDAELVQQQIVQAQNSKLAQRLAVQAVTFEQRLAALEQRQY